jgi:hypothetical protein
MADYPITATARRVVYSGSAGTGPYNFSFPVLTSTDIDVYKDTTKLTLTTDYSVTISASDGTGSVTLGSAATSDNTVTIVGARAIQRTTDFVTAGDLLASSLNTELDSQTIFVQQASEDATRAIKAPVTDPTSIDMTLPVKASRLGKLLGFDSSTGNPEAVTGRVNSVSVSTVTPTNGAAGSATASFVESTGVLSLGVPQGSTGIGGVGMQYSTTTTDSDPGAGFIRLNNTSLNSATIMYVDDSDGTNDITAWVQSWDNSTSGSKGFITISGNPNAASPLVIFKVTGAVTDASGYTKIPVAYVAGSTSISNAAEISIQFSPAGDGNEAGLDYAFSTTTTDSDPGAGNLRLNHGTVGSASAIYIDDTDANGADMSAYILTWDDSTNSADRGTVYITKKASPATYAIFKVSGASTDASGYVKLAVTHVASNGSFSNGDTIAVEFSRTGNAGSLSDPMTTRGDIIIRNASNATARLAVGSANTVLKTDGTDISYGQVATAMIADDAVSLAKMASGTDGNLITYDASGNPAHVATGSSGQVLTSNGAGAAPTFQAAAGGGKVLQVVTAATSTEATSTSSTYADTNLTADITPANSSNKILVLVSQSISSTGGRAGGALRILRGTTEIEEYNQISNVENQMGQHFIQHLDSPSSTSSTTYHTEFARIDQSSTVTAQRNDSSGNATSTITLIELDYS